MPLTARVIQRILDQAEAAANALKLTADDLMKLGVIDRIVAEPMGGAHRDPEAAIGSLGEALEEALAALAGMSGGELKSLRREKFLEMGRARLS